MTTPKLGLNELVANQSQPHIPLNSALRKLDTLVQLTVQGRAINTPPSTPDDGDAYIVGPAPSGFWSTFSENDVAFYVSNAWAALTPQEGWAAWSVTDAAQFIFNGAAWSESGGGGGTGNGAITVLDRALNTPPVSPADGDYYIVGASPTGAWSGFAENSLAKYTIGVWVEILPMDGQLAWVDDEHLFYYFYGTWLNQSAQTNLLTAIAWDHKGDLLVGTGADTAAVLRSDTAANTQILVRDDAQTTGLKWRDENTDVCSNVGGGVGLFKGETAGAGQVTVHEFYTLAAGTNISFNQVGDLLTIAASGGGGVSDGDKGDITVTSSGATWTVDNGAISRAKLSNSFGLSVIGRSASSVGVPADILAANDGEVLRRSGTSIGFGQLILAAYANNSVDNTKLADFTAASRLLGRGSASGGGDPQEISIGTGLSMSGTSLIATGGGASTADANDYNGMSTPQSPFTSETYLFGSDVNVSDASTSRTPHQGTFYRCKIVLTKTGAGTAAPVIKVRIGQNSSTADTLLATLTFGASTAVADDAVIEVLANFITTGAGTSAQLACAASLIHNLSTTGFQTLSAKVVKATSSTFNSTIDGDYMGLTLTGGGSDSWTASIVQAEICNR